MSVDTLNQSDLMIDFGPLEERKNGGALSPSKTFVDQDSHQREKNRKSLLTMVQNEISPTTQTISNSN